MKVHKERRNLIKRQAHSYKCEGEKKELIHTSGARVLDRQICINGNTLKRRGGERFSYRFCSLMSVLGNLLTGCIHEDEEEKKGLNETSGVQVLVC